MPARACWLSTGKPTVTTCIGAVTIDEAGRRIEVLMGERPRHAMAPDARDAQSTVEGKVSAEAGMGPVEEKGDLGQRVSLAVQSGERRCDRLHGGRLGGGLAHGYA
jgi:hypothetical protein